MGKKELPTLEKKAKVVCSMCQGEKGRGVIILNKVHWLACPYCDGLGYYERGV